MSAFGESSRSCQAQKGLMRAPVRFRSTSAFSMKSSRSYRPTPSERRTDRLSGICQCRVIRLYFNAFLAALDLEDFVVSNSQQDRPRRSSGLRTSLLMHASHEQLCIAEFGAFDQFESHLCWRCEPIQSGFSRFHGCPWPPGMARLYVRSRYTRNFR
jgi:hypothetical protein